MITHIVIIALKLIVTTTIKDYVKLIFIKEDLDIFPNKMYLYLLVNYTDCHYNIQCSSCTYLEMSSLLDLCF